METKTVTPIEDYERVFADLHDAAINQFDMPERETVLAILDTLHKPSKQCLMPGSMEGNKMNGKLFTTGKILKELSDIDGLDGINIFNIKYVISKLNLKPIARAGHMRVFNKDQVQLIKQELFKIRYKTSYYRQSEIENP